MDHFQTLTKNLCKVKLIMRELYDKEGMEDMLGVSLELPKRQMKSYGFGIL